MLVAAEAFKDGGRDEGFAKVSDPSISSGKFIASDMASVGRSQHNSRQWKSDAIIEKYTRWRKGKAEDYVKHCR